MTGRQRCYALSIASLSTLPTASSRPLAPPDARSRLLLAAPLVGLAGWPLWAVGATTLTLVLARRWDALRRVRLLAFLGLVVAGSLPSWLAAPDLLAAWSAVQATLPLLLGALLLHTALWALEGGTRLLGTALLGLLLLGSALFGTGEPWTLVWGAVGLLLAVSGAPGQDESRALRPLSGRRMAFRWLILGAVGVGLLLTALSSPLPTQSDRVNRVGTPAWVGEWLARLVTDHVEDWQRSLCPTGTPGCGFAAVRKNPAPPGERRAMRQADDASALPEPAPPRRVDDPLAQFRGRTGVVLLTAVLVVVLGWLLWRRLRLHGPPGQLPPSPADLGLAPADTALHRVRVAYRSALASLAQAGLGRAEAETPAEHAARVSALRPETAGALRTLLAVYAPVRYGLSPPEEGAEQAEEAASTLARLSGGRALPVRAVLPRLEESQATGSSPDLP